MILSSDRHVRDQKRQEDELFSVTHLPCKLSVLKQKRHLITVDLIKYLSVCLEETVLR